MNLVGSFGKPLRPSRPFLVDREPARLTAPISLSRDRLSQHGSTGTKVTDDLTTAWIVTPSGEPRLTVGGSRFTGSINFIDLFLTL